VELGRLETAMNAMTKTSAMIDALETINDACAGWTPAPRAADDVAARRALFEVHAKAARRVALYEFKFPRRGERPGDQRAWPDA
jgi:hypothetical protein